MAFGLEKYFVFIKYEVLGLLMIFHSNVSVSCIPVDIKWHGVYLFKFIKLISHYRIGIPNVHQISTIGNIV